MIRDIVLSDKPTLSMEIFPPRHSDLDKNCSRYYDVQERCREVISLHPDYISVTHRAGSSFEDTLNVCKTVRGHGIPCVAHMRARDIDFDNARLYAEECKKLDVAVMPVTGDEYIDPDLIVSTDKHHFESSYELTRFLSNFDVEILGTFYPEGDKVTQLEEIARKSSKGAGVFVSQMIFDMDKWREFVSYVRCCCSDAILVPGILPILSSRSYVKQKGQVNIPERFLDFAAKGVDSMGILYANDEIKYLLDNGCKHVHLFTMDDYISSKAIQKGFIEYARLYED